MYGLSVGSKLDHVLPSVFFTLSIFLATAFFLLKSENKKISIKVFIIYSLTTILLFALASLVGLLSVEKPVVNFIILQAIFFVYGVIHTIVLYNLNSWTEHDQFWHELVFTIFIGMLGVFVFLYMYQLINLKDTTYKLDYTLYFACSVIFILIPFLIAKAALAGVNIPHSEYPKWFYPVAESEFEIPEEYFEDRNVIVVEFNVVKNPDESAEVTKSKAKAPLKLEFGKYYTYYLFNYNDESPGEPIRYVDQYKQPYGWNFYVQTKWWQRRKYIDPDLSIRENEINDRDIIIAERV